MVDKQRTLPELLAPAGDMERLKMAVLYGADAVYLAGTDFGMRAFAGNFDPDELKAAVAYAHAHNVRVHCTINTMPRGDEIVRLPEHLERLNDAGVDAVIVADLGAFTLAGKYAPNCQRHISTQASISNYVTANAWYDLGASRVILARELSLEEIRTIRENTPAELEIEAFVHGLAGAGAGDVLPRGDVRQLFRAVSAEQLYDGPGCQPRRLRPALPLSLRPDGGKTPRRIFPH